MKEEKKISESREYFGPLYPYIVDEEITDIDYNGRELWLTDSNNRRFLCEDCIFPEGFVEQFTKRIANTVSKPFHKQNPVLEAETDKLRITVVHESVAISGRSFCIRKSLPKVRIHEEEMLSSGYCSQEMLYFLKNCIRSKCNIVVCGEPGSGKTECAKFFSQFIPENERVITIEDNPEWHYANVNPNKDSIELKVSDVMDYTTAIKTCLRLNPKWMFLSEVRSTEVQYLIEGFSTGVHGITTLHTDDVRTVPDRMINMAQKSKAEDRLENDIYTFVDVALLIRRREVTEQGRTVVKRFIDQIGIFYREDKENYFRMISQDGEIINRELPEYFKKKFLIAGIEDPFFCEEDMRIKLEESARQLMEEEIRTRIDTKIHVSEEESMRKHREDCVRQWLEEVKEEMYEEIQERGTYMGQKSIVG